MQLFRKETCSLFSQNYVFISQQARAEQEEEFISNTLFKKIQALQKEKETLAVNYEKEEEFLTNELSRKLMQVIGAFTDGSPRSLGTDWWLNLCVCVTALWGKWSGWKADTW